MFERQGGASYITELARRLGSSGAVASTIFAGVHDNAFIADHDRMRGVNVIGREAPTPYARRSVVGALDYGAFRIYQSFCSKPDVYHPSYYPRRIGRQRGVALVATVYDMIHERLPEFHHGDPTPGRKRALVEAADKILCISETTAADLATFYGVDPAKVVVTYLGAGSDEWSISRPVAPRRAGRPYFLYVGRRTGYKNFQVLLEAYISDAMLSGQTRLLAVGGGGWTASERALISKAGRGAVIEQLDADEGQLQRLYGGAIALCVPSLYEGFGLPAVEAMRAECPVIANAAGSLPEIVGDAGVVVSLTGPDVLAAAMRSVLENDEQRAIYRERGRARARDFDWNRTAALTLEAYREVAPRR
jgi:glycosyltransferase involved in cell wall biosynthesis